MSDIFSTRAADGTRLSYRTAGTSGPWITLCHALMASSVQWTALVPVLACRFQVLYPDSRGHGDSGPSCTAFTIADLAADIATILDRLEIGRTHLLGASMSGLVAEHFAAAHPGRVDRLVLSNTTWRYGPEAAPSWQQRIALVAEQGIDAVVAPTLGRFLTEAFRTAEPERTAHLAAAMRRTDPSSFAGCCRALDGADLSDALARISAPTLLIAGADDIATTPAIMRDLSAQIAGSELVVLPGAHLCNYEHGDVYAATLEAFLNRS